MSTSIFVNLPVRDLGRSVAFFGALGFSFNPQFTDETATCMVISDTIYAMLLTEARFQEFTPLPVADATKTTQVLLGLSRDDREAVDDLLQRALSAGATEARPAQDHGFMYARSCSDLDGHIWEIFWMDPSFVQS